VVECNTHAEGFTNQLAFMMKIDAHQHFWQFDPVRDSWITGEMKTIQRDFLPVDLKPVLERNDMDGCITVQAAQSEEENAFLLTHADAHNFIKGVVGWVDLQAPDVEERLEHYRSYKKMKGFRHVLQGEAQRDFMLRPAFKNGISLLQRFGFSYDILIYPDQLPFVRTFVAAFPEQRFVIDHIAKPYIRDKKIEEWKEHMQALAQYEQVYCKISGMVTEADWKQWTKADFTPYLDVVVEAFGPHRVVFGSDWPVCLVAAPYEAVLQVATDYFSSFSQSEQENFFGGNATRFYNL
jgi:L-fuconolactonase